MRQPARFVMASNPASSPALRSSLARPAGAKQLVAGAGGVVAAGKRALRAKGKPDVRRETTEEGPSWTLIGIVAGAVVAALVAAFLVIAYARSGGTAAAACHQIGQTGLVHAVVCPTGLSGDDLASAGENACDEPLGTPCMAYIWMGGPEAPARLPMSRAQSSAVWAVWSNWDGVLRNCRRQAC